MKRKITLWVIIALIATLIYSIGTNSFSGNNDLFNLGKLLIPILFTLIIPLILGLIFSVLSKIFNQDSKIVFSRATWIFQILLIIILLFSMFGQNAAKANNHTLSNLPQNGIELSNDKISFTIPNNWNYENMQLLNNQLYNILCYSQTGNMRISAVSNIMNITAKSYYDSYKTQLFNDLKTKSTDLMIKSEKSIIFQNEKAYKVEYEYKFKGQTLYGETLCFSKNIQMIIISSTVLDTNQKQSINNILNSITIK